MDIYALVGKSGTGKSYQAINICRKYNIEAIVDDGLFICEGRAISGKSAKREATSIGAIKRAIFQDENHRKTVVKAIKKRKPGSILILGTSKNMVDRISQKLELDNIDEYIDIKDVTSESERKIADKQRNQLGKHVVPVAALHLKQEFSGYILSPLRIFRGLGDSNKDDSEKTVVRPTYSYMGEFTISEKVIKDIVRCTARELSGISEVMKVNVTKREEIINVHIVATLFKGENIPMVAEKLQRASGNMIEKMTAFRVKRINIYIKHLS